MSGFELTCFSSPADGISSGSVIVQVGEDKGPKYLFNAPEGFARLVLEHKVRPSQHLRAAFLTQLQPHAAGGLAGLIMRLCQDGHKELQVHGPIGLAANLHGLRHFVRWKHPRVFASEHSQWEPPQVYEDGHVHVAALQQGGLAWPCPAWLRPPDNQHEAAPPGNSALITPNKSSAAVNALGREQAVNYISTGLADAKGGKEPHKAEWVQMQDGGNPLYLQQKHGLPGEVSRGKTDMGIWGYLVHFKATGMLLLLVDNPSVHAVSAIAKHPVCHYMQQQPSRCAGVVHLSSPEISSKGAYIRWSKSLPGQQVMLNGGKLHIFQSAMRATARLHLLSPAVFPLPFGAKVPPSQAPTTAVSKKVDDLTPVPNKQAIKSVMKAVLHKAGSKASNAVLPSVADVVAQRLQALIAGPVTKVVSGNKGLGVADRDTTELKTPSLGEVQQELLNSKPAFARFVEQLKGSHPAFFQQTKPAKAASQQTTILHGAAASAQMSPASFSRQITPSNLQNPDHLPRHQQKKRNGNAVSISHDLLSHAAEPGFSGNHTHGAWPEQRSFHAQHQGMGLPGTIMHPQGHSVGPFPNAPQMPAPPPGFALVPIASDGSLHYPGAIVSPNAVGGNMWQPQSFGYSAPSEHSQATQQQLTQLNFLGTGSAEPSKYRGASAIHIRLDSGWGVLLDAGEGSWGSLVRMYGHKAAFDQVNSLALVWISHKHADHMLGLPAILAARHTSCPPLQVVGPSEAAKWLSDISTAQQLRYSFLHCSQLNRMSQQQQFEMLNHTGLESLRAVPVNHCYDAYGLVMLHTDSWKLVYSGDTRPCRALQEAGRECTLLIHEATFEPELLAEGVALAFAQEDSVADTVAVSNE
ncbi:hypothetical protein WJX82_008144 [Trebouxia sp. C0006]